MSKDITYCTAAECPSKDCERKLTNNTFEPNEVVSMANFAGVCRFYIRWVVSQVEKEK